MKKVIYAILIAALATAMLGSCQDVPEPYTNPNENKGGNKEVLEPGTPTGTGTAADPYNVTAVLEKVKALKDGEKLENIFVKGKIRFIKAVDTGSYGNADYYISDDNTKKMDTLHVFRGLYLGNVKFTAQDQIKVGDEVVITGTFINFKGNKAETEANKSWIHSLNGKVAEVLPLVPGEAKGAGTEADPYNVTAALAKIRSLAADGKIENIYVKGKIRYIKNVDTEQYGNAQYYISDDHTQRMDTLFIFRSMYLGNAKFTAKDQIKVGDEVIIQGTFINFKGNTPETEGNKSWIYSLNGKKAENNPLVPGVAKGTGTEADPYNVTAALAKIRALAADGKIEKTYVKGKIRYIKSVDTGQYGNAVYYISDDNTKMMDSLQIFRSMYLGNTKFTAKDQIKVGDEVVIYGTFINFKGNTPETEGNKSYIYMLNGKKGNGGTTPEKPETPQTGKGLSIDGQVVTLTNANTEAGTESVVYEMSKLGGTDIKPIKSIDLAAGLKMTFDKGGEQNAPNYFKQYHQVRVYKNNSFTITGNKKIAKVILNCDKLETTSFVGNSTATVSFNGNSVTYKNVFSEPKGGGVQMRILKVTVVYAK